MRPRPDQEQGLGSALRASYPVDAPEGLDPDITRLMLILSQDAAAGRPIADPIVKATTSPPPRAGLLHRVRAILR